MISATEAHRMGLVNHVVATDQLLLKSQELIQKMINRSPLAIGSAIRAVNASSIDGTNGFEVEIKEFANCFGTPDFQEGVHAFLEKRKAVFLH